MGEAEREMFRLAIELAKFQLSTQQTATLHLPDGRMHQVTRDVLEGAIQNKVEETRGPIDKCLQDLKIDPSAIDHLVLVGGSSKIPHVRQFVSEVLGKEPAVGADPMTAVAEGASIAAAILSGELDADFFVATEHALGTISVNDRGVEEFSELIGRNHQLPAKASGGYRPVNQGQKTVCVRVIEGDPTVPLDDEENVILKEWDIEIDPSRSPEDSGFSILYEYDVDGILHVTVTDEQTQSPMLKEDLSFGVSRDKSSLVTLAKDVSATMAGKPLGDGPAAATAAPGPEAAAADPATTKVLERVRDKIIPFIDDDEAQRLEGMCQDLENAAGAAIESCRSGLEVEASKYAYLY